MRPILTPREVEEIRMLAAQRVPQKVIGARYGVIQQTVSHIITGRNWKPKQAKPRKTLCSRCKSSKKRKFHPYCVECYREYKAEWQRVREQRNAVRSLRLWSVVERSTRATSVYC